MPKLIDQSQNDHSMLKEQSKKAVLDVLSGSESHLARANMPSVGSDGSFGSCPSKFRIKDWINRL